MYSTHPASKSLEVALSPRREVAKPIVWISKLLNLLVLQAKSLHYRPLICGSTPFCCHLALDLFDPLGGVSRVNYFLLYAEICLLYGELRRVAKLCHLTGKLVCTCLVREQVCGVCELVYSEEGLQ